MRVVNRHTADDVWSLTGSRAVERGRGLKERTPQTQEGTEWGGCGHQGAELFLSSSSESLWMVMMLTAGLGVSEMMMG